jgi:hypothetical protein
MQSSGGTEVPGLGVDSAQQIIAEVGALAATFASTEDLSSSVGACPGEEEERGVNYVPGSPKGNRHMRRLLHQAANAAAKHKGRIFEIVYRRLGHNKTIGAIAHRIGQLIWTILNKGVRYEERGPAVSENSRRARTSRIIPTLRKLGYRVELLGGSGMSSAISEPGKLVAALTQASGAVVGQVGIDQAGCGRARNASYADSPTQGLPSVAV